MMRSCCPQPIVRRLRSSQQPRSKWAFSSSSSSSSSSEHVVTREDLLKEATGLTKALYRTCMRSTKVIRWGNALDDKEFDKREEDFLTPSGGPGGRISMSPPPDREDELRSRSEYYQSYAREYFVQESDCLDNDPLREKDIRRFVYYLRKGEKDRKWLLGDMMFPDPFKNSMDQERVKHFEAMAKKYLGEEDDDEEEQTVTTSSDDFFDADDENPEWFKQKFSNLK